MYSSEKDHHPFTPVAPSKHFIAVAAIISAVLGLVTLGGWHAHIPALLQLRPDLVPMQYNAAFCMLLSGAGLCAFTWQHLRLAQVFGAMVAMLSSLTLCEYLFGLDLGIDQLFFRAYITTQTFHPGRMSPSAALCLLHIGLALFLMGLRFERRWRAMALGSLGSVIIAVCVAAIVGYAVDLPGTYGWGRFTRLAPQTAVGLSFLGAAIFIAGWNEGRQMDEKTPRWLPVPLALGVLAVSLVFSEALASKQNQGSAQLIKASAEGVESIINLSMEARIHSLERLGRHWEFSGKLSQASWENDAKNYAHDFPDVQALEWTDSQNLRWTAPLADAEASADQNPALVKRRRAAEAMARQSRGPMITRIVELPHGGSGFIICVPVYTGTSLQGCITGLFDARALFDRYLPASIAAGYAINISQDGRAFYGRNPGSRPANSDWISDSTVEQGETSWNVQVWPLPALVAQMDSSLPRTVLFAGLVRAAVLGLIVYLAQKSSAQARKTSTLNLELESALGEVRTLSGMLPICSGCKRIRDDDGYWNEIERYVSRHSGASFSHGICPACAKTFYETEGLEVPDDVLKAVEKHYYD